MLPGNVILREVPEGVEVGMIDPAATRKAIDSDELKRVAAKVRDSLAVVLDAIQSEPAGSRK